MADGAPDETLTGVLLFNLGGPDDLGSVEPFLINLFSDRDIIELPLGAVTQPIFARLIAKLRGPSVRRYYALIGGGSPQLRITSAQGSALEARLNAGRAPALSGALREPIPGSAVLGSAHSSPRGDDPSYTDRTRSAAGPIHVSARDASPASVNIDAQRFRTFIAMRYWHPSTEEALIEMERAGVRRVVTLPLFPHWSKATTGSSQKALDSALSLPRWKDHRFTISAIDQYPDDPLYLDAFADTVRSALDRFPGASRERAVIVFSAHGLPQKFVDDGDPYIEQIEATRRGLLARLAVQNRQVLGYQSRTGPVKWIGPGTDEMIRELGREGVKQLLVVPLSFVSDHIETLYEVDILFAGIAREAGIVDYQRPAALNTHPLFIESLARLVERRLTTATPAASSGQAPVPDPSRG